MERPKRVYIDFIPSLLVAGLGILMVRALPRLNWDPVFGGVLLVCLVNTALVIFVSGKKSPVWYLVPSSTTWIIGMILISLSGQMNRAPTFWYWAAFTIGSYAIEKLARSRKVV